MPIGIRNAPSITTKAARERKIDGTPYSVGGLPEQVKGFRKDRQIQR
jgi:hypothetical protein